MTCREKEEEYIVCCVEQLGVIVVYGVDRDDVKAGAERPFGDLCIRSFIMHSSMEYSEIIMSGACSYEGKTFKAVASSKPGTFAYGSAMVFSYQRKMLSVKAAGTAAAGWRRGVVVTELVVSTKLLYAEPG